MRAPLLPLLACALALAAGCTAPSQSTPPGNATTGATPATTTTLPPATPGANATSDLAYVASQSGPPGNDTTYRFDGPDVAAAGWVAVHLENQGLEPHQAALYKLLGGSFEDLVAALHAPPSNATNASMPQALAVGGVGISLPGQSATTWVKLDAGTYAVLCFVPDPMGMPHAIHGMAKKLTVVNATGAPATPPAPDVALTLVDYRFQLGGNLSAGHHVIRVANNGSHSHEAPFVKLQGNHTLEDFLDAVSGAGNATGGLPITAGGGGSALAPGRVEYVEADLTPGRYGFFCFEQDAPTSPPHVALGMTLEVDVTR